jgi:hypothetical protein
MAQQLSQRDGLPGGRRVFEVRGDRIFQPELAIADQEHDSGGNELLADRTDLEHRIAGHRRLQLDVGETERPDGNRLAVAQYRNGNAGQSLIGHLGSQVCVDRIRGRRRHKQDQQPSCHG